MKKLVFMMMAFMLCLVSCKNNKPEPTPTPDPYNYERVMNEDLNTYMKTGTIFYESQITFTTNVCDSNVVISQILNVFQDGDTCIQVLHDKDGNTKINKEKDYWLEDRPVNYEMVGLSLQAAIKELDKLDTKVESKFCTLRRPLYKIEYPHAFYIFGDQHYGHYFAVDSESGEITEM